MNRGQSHWTLLDSATGGIPLEASFGLGSSWNHRTRFGRIVGYRPRFDAGGRVSRRATGTTGRYLRALRKRAGDYEGLTGFPISGAVLPGSFENWGRPLRLVCRLLSSRRFQVRSRRPVQIRGLRAATRLVETCLTIRRVNRRQRACPASESNSFHR